MPSRFPQLSDLVENMTSPAISKHRTLPTPYFPVVYSATLAKEESARVLELSTLPYCEEGTRQTPRNESDLDKKFRDLSLPRYGRVFELDGDDDRAQ